MNSQSYNWKKSERQTDTSIQNFLGPKLFKLKYWKDMVDFGISETLKETDKKKAHKLFTKEQKQLKFFIFMKKIVSSKKRLLHIHSVSM